MTSKSILTDLDTWAERVPNKTLYAFLDKNGDTTDSLTYRQFVQRTIDIAGHIQRGYKLKPGQRVLLAHPPGVELICAFFACVRLGLIPVPVYPPLASSFESGLYKMNFIARDCQASAILTQRSCYWAIKVNKARTRIATFSFKRDYVSKLKWIVTDQAESHKPHEITTAHSDIVFLQYTSGSTHDPKGVMVTHDNLLSNCDVTVDHLPIGVSWLPQYHDMGLIGYYIFFALKGGTTYGFSPLDFIQRPALWLETISRYRGTASSAPNFAYAYCLRPNKISEETLGNLDLSSLRFLTTGAEPVQPATYLAFLDKFKPQGLNPTAFFSAYGLAEYTLVVSNYGRTISAFDKQHMAENKVTPVTEAGSGEDTTSLVSCGPPLPGTEVRIVDTADVPHEVAPGKVGEIWITGPSKCRGYWGRPELSAQTFEAKLAGDDENTWLRSGDLGFVRDDEVYICGRIKDAIIIRGLNYYPHDVEILVEDDPAIRKGCVAAFAWPVGDVEQLVVVAELKNPKRVPEAVAINQRIFQRLGIKVDRFVYIPARTISKTTSGKLRRFQVRESWIDGSLDVIGQANACEPLVTEVAATEPETAVSAIFRKHGLSGDERAVPWDAGIDSLGLVDLACDVEGTLETLGHGDLAKLVDLRLLQKIEIAELSNLLNGLLRADDGAAQRFRTVLAGLERECQEIEQASMREDAKLVLDPAMFRGRALQVHGGKQCVLLTGGTGFFGPFLLKSLLEQCDGDIYVLVRANNAEDGWARICEGLDTLDASESENRTWKRRVHPICGDLAKHNFGLSDADWKLLVDKVNVIYHNGALVNYVLDYAAMRDVNVGGTNEIIRFALQGRAKTLNYISTTFVFGWSVLDTLFEQDTNEDLDLLDFGYSQTKWVAEQLILEAMRRGLQARIFRPALITPSVNGGGLNFDISIRLLAFMLKHGISTTSQNQVSFSPADVVADNIVAISNDSKSVGNTYHVTRDSYSNMGHITSILADLTSREFTDLTLDDFVPEVIDKCGKDDLLFPLLSFFTRSITNITSMEFKRYDNSNYQQARSRVSAARKDPPLEDVVLGILRFMQRQGIAHGVGGHDGRQVKT